MNINFNTNFSDFFDHSEVYKEVYRRIQEDKGWKIVPMDIKEKYKVAFRAVMELVVLHPSDVVAKSFKIHAISELLTDNNSKDLVEYFKKIEDFQNKNGGTDIPGNFIKSLVCFYFARSNCAERNSLEERLVAEVEQWLNPSASVHGIDFNGVHKDFFRESQVFNSWLEQLEDDNEYQAADSAKQKDYKVLLGACAEILALHPRYYFNGYYRDNTIADMISAKNSHKVVEFIKAKQKGKQWSDIDPEGGLVKTLLGLYIRKSTGNSENDLQKLEKELIHWEQENMLVSA